VAPPEGAYLTFDWSNSEAIGLAKESCAHCLGIGLRRDGRFENMPCSCVLRRIFRSCYAKFRYCATREKPIGQVRLEAVKGTEGNFSFGMKEEEYMADFCLVSKRALEPLEYDIFRCHFLLGADWRLCCRRLKLDRGTFFHHLYRIEQKLGRVYRELQPHALFPLDEYFGGKSRKELPYSYRQAVIAMPLPARGSPLRAPLKKVA
jgi:hypothetical protein